MSSPKRRDHDPRAIRLALLISILSAVAVTFLFHRRAPGLNLLFIEIPLFGWLLASGQLTIKNKRSTGRGGPDTGWGGNSMTWLVVAGFWATSLATVISHSLFAFIMHFVCIFLLGGVMIHLRSRSLVHTAGLAIVNLIGAQAEFFRSFRYVRVRGIRAGRKLWRWRIFLIPLLVVIVFIIIYRNSNPVFDDLMATVGSWIKAAWRFITENIDLMALFTFSIAILFTNFVLIRYRSKYFMWREGWSADELERKRKQKKRKRFRPSALINEYRSGIFLLATLNALLLLVNILDIRHVWFVFEWEGQYLKEFVHRGTFLLILSIFISIAIVLYYFRGNLNFYSRNSLLKKLSYIWLAQNVILAVSVAMRNIWYIKYFALAYKRIGVFIFLALVIFGLIYVGLKVRWCRSLFYLLRKNAMALFLVLVLFSLPNWDAAIARYNFSHAGTAFLHLDFLSELSHKALPYLDVSLEELEEIEELQEELFPFEHNYMDPEEYRDEIEDRKREFRHEWQDKGFLSWNRAENRAYRTLFGED